ncbi:unnamed protein product [Cylicocyclus nassatus]|uniref:[heparan sulfate]-glucosamine N-sulfotransferase n=1 Tax=Cylicocyclus nassatus TaxID=53992 RepID=A0AA36H649_CYLNA|nr:unnamed protein product [Cylicocyclus nassatus]
MLPYSNWRLLKFLKCLLSLSIVTCVLLIYNVSFREDIAVKRYPPQHLPIYTCPNSFVLNNTSSNQPAAKLHGNLTEDRALILLESAYSRHGRLLQQVFGALKYPFEAEALSKSLPSLVAVNKVCRKGVDAYWTRTKLRFWQDQEVASLKVVESSIHRISRVGAERSDINVKGWTLFEESSTYSTIVSARDAFGRPRAAVVHVSGDDGVERFLFGHNVSDWTMKMTYLDILWYSSGGNIGWSLDRYLQIDIDDIFVGARGTRMVESDVRALLESQNAMRRFISNFTYMLGFSGGYFRNGDDNEDKGDELLIELADHFIWFPHMWRHNHAHEHNLTYLEATMAQNLMFAQNMRLPVRYPYAIAPQHDGVYPVHSELYTAWKKVWKVQVTATEEYPHFKPALGRKGFIYANVSVLPRQTCGLYTHTQFFHNYPGGFGKLISSIQGGELFFTVLLNPISIFMTHQQNFAHDRLALYTFDSLVRFIKCWTNVKLLWQNPVASAKMYFSLLSQEKVPIWSNPCNDSRHKLILPPSLNCENLTLPNALIVGPQKTGSTALATFLSLHPNVSTNAPIAHTFEEMQFFGGANYHREIEWYAHHFSKSRIIFEKSATYFDNGNAAKDAFALIPDAKIIVILSDPSRRAYSWYQHVLAHNDTAALSARNLLEILDSDVIELKRIKQRCISGGRYAHHLARWLEFYPMSNLILIDGERLRDEPVQVMTELTKSLNLPYFDYSSAIRYSSSKRFFCKFTNGSAKCLGRSKGRIYPPMSPELSARLNRIFLHDNIALHKFLVKNHLPVPKWLQSLFPP